MSTDLFLSHNWGPPPSYENHIRVSKINDALKSRGYQTWFDDDRMHGNVPAMMASGIDNTKLVLVFVTSQYRDKVNRANKNDNCKLEFEYALHTKSAERAIPVVMETDMRNTSKWRGVLGFYLSRKLYVDMSDVDPNKFSSQMDVLCLEIENHGVQPSGPSTGVKPTTASTGQLTVNQVPAVAVNKISLKTNVNKLLDIGFNGIETIGKDLLQTSNDLVKLLL